LERQQLYAAMLAFLIAIPTVYFAHPGYCSAGRFPNQFVTGALKFAPPRRLGGLAEGLAINEIQLGIFGRTRQVRCSPLRCTDRRPG
jgi:hypothetical protein